MIGVDLFVFVEEVEDPRLCLCLLGWGAKKSKKSVVLLPTKNHPDSPLLVSSVGALSERLYLSGR